MQTGSYSSFSNTNVGVLLSTRFFDERLPKKSNPYFSSSATTFSTSISSVYFAPFGVELDQRHGAEDERYRYSFQGQETDKEIKGEGNSVNYKYRMHDPRIGRFFAIDPLSDEYAYNSPYAFSENRVLDGVELEGLEFNNVHYYNMVKQDDGTEKPTKDPVYSSDVLSLKCENAMQKSLHGNLKRNIQGNCTYLRQDAYWVNVYTYWNSDKTMRLQVVKSSNDQISNTAIADWNKISMGQPPKYNLSSDLSFDFMSTNAYTDITLAVGGTISAIGQNKLNVILGSRTGYTSVSSGAKIYNKATLQTKAFGLYVAGHAITLYGVYNANLQYKAGLISEGRKNYSYLNAGVGTIAPITAIPLAVGDYLGQKNSKWIEYQVTEGAANKAVGFVFTSLGMEVSPTGTTKTP